MKAPPIARVIRPSIAPPAPISIVTVRRPGWTWISGVFANPESAKAYYDRIDGAFVKPFAKGEAFGSDMTFPFYIYDASRKEAAYEFIQTESEIVDRLRAIPLESSPSHVYAIIHRVDAPFAPKTPGNDELAYLPRRLVDNVAMKSIRKTGKLDLKIERTR